MSAAICRLAGVRSTVLGQWDDRLTSNAADLIQHARGSAGCGVCAAADLLSTSFRRRVVTDAVDIRSVGGWRVMSDNARLIAGRGRRRNMKECEHNLGGCVRREAPVTLVLGDVG